LDFVFLGDWNYTVELVVACKFELHDFLHPRAGSEAGVWSEWAAAEHECVGSLVLGLDFEAVRIVRERLSLNVLKQVRALKGVLL